MLNDFIAWWTSQMLQWVPARWAERDPAAINALLLQPQDGQAVATLRRQRRDRPLGRFALDAAGLRDMRRLLPPGLRTAIVLQMPPALLLERDVTLPLAAEREPERVLAYEMDRITPFAADEVFWTYAVERRDRANARLHLRVSMVLRAAVQPVLDTLAQAGLPPAVMQLPGGDGALRRIALDRPDSRRARLERTALRTLQAACAVLAVLAVALPFLLQASAARQVQAEIQRLQPRVTEADHLRQRIATATAGVDVVAAERQRVGDAIAVLAAVTRALPDDTYLMDLTLRQGRLTISGQSAEAVRLIAAMAADPLLRNPEFTAPVTRIGNGHADLFAIRAEVVR